MVKKIIFFLKIILQKSYIINKGYHGYLSRLDFQTDRKIYNDVLSVKNIVFAFTDQPRWIVYKNNRDNI